MGNSDILFQKETIAKHDHADVIDVEVKVRPEPDRPGSYRITLNSNGFPILLLASLALSNLYLYDAGTNWKGENAPTISAGVGSQKAALNKKRISAKEAGRLALFYLERAEAQRRQYVEELARIQTELFKLGD